VKNLYISGIALVCAAIASSPLNAQESDGEQPLVSTQSGVYTEAQAESGAELFEANCSSCHMAQDFIGVFMRSWSGATAGALFDLISTMMPEDRPGSLRPREYASVLAYIFKRNGMPAGEVRLASRKDLLDTILIEWRPQ